MSWNFFAAHTIARSQAAEPVGLPPMPSHSSRRSVNSGVSPLARAASLFGESCASKPKALRIKTKNVAQAFLPVLVLTVRIIPVNHSFLHHEENFFRLSNILQRI